MRLVGDELLSEKRDRSRERKNGGGGGEEFGNQEIEFHAPFIVVAQTCILDLHEHYALL